MAGNDIALMAHLMTRAGFGATRGELDVRLSSGYDQTVEDLLHPERQERVDRLEFLRYHPWAWRPGTMSNPGSTSWLYNMITTERPLEEKMTLFWHQIFATGVSKVDHWDEVADMIDIFRAKGMGSYRELLLEVSKSPAMIFWLDNHENHAGSINENWGRELLELFSMGVGTYTEEDVLECSRAFTGWTIKHKLPRFPYGRFDWSFQFIEQDHDDGVKSFLGENGRFNGDDIVGIICRQPATARFVSRHLYNFFVADEVQVPAWSTTPPRDPDAIDILANSFIESGGDIRSMLRVLFHSDFFKQARHARVKSPAEVVVNTMRLVGGAEFPVPGYGELARQPGYLGQELLDPPSVEGWHTGVEWIDTGALVERVNFMTSMVGDIHRPGIKSIVGEIRANAPMSPEALVDASLDLMGALEVGAETRRSLVDHAGRDGELSWKDDQKVADSTQKVLMLLNMIVSSKEYSLA